MGGGQGGQGQKWEVDREGMDRNVCLPACPPAHLPAPTLPLDPGLSDDDS